MAIDGMNEGSDRSMAWRYCHPASLPTKDQALEAFVSSSPQYLNTSLVDRIREEEYHHLDQTQQQICLDYTGIGLFSFQQQQQQQITKSLKIGYVFRNLATHALYPQESSAESVFRKRVLSYMNLQTEDYCIVFAANTLCAFKLLAESYPFHLSPKLLLGYDHECESIEWMRFRAKSKGARVIDAAFVWPELRFDDAELKKTLQQKNGGGLFAYPVVSKISGAKQSFAWITEAQQNGWNVVVDVSGLGMKAMDSLGVSLYRPDFIIASFYKVFGCDPTGFACLIIKRHILKELGDSSRARAVGMVNMESLNSAAISAMPAFQGGTNPLFKLSSQGGSPSGFPSNSSYKKIDVAELNDKRNCLEEEEAFVTSFPTSCSPRQSGFYDEHDGFQQMQRTDFKVLDTAHCCGLDYAERVGLTRINIRQRSLLYWLISSFRKLRHPLKGNRHLVTIYGSLSQNDRGSTVAFNLFDSSKAVLDPILVQKLADRNNISLGIGTIHAIFRREESNQRTNIEYKGSFKLGVGSSRCVIGSSTCVVVHSHSRAGTSELFQRKRVPVLSATLDLLTNFGDVYSLWVFVAKFLDPKYSHQEHLQYQSLNQETVHL